MWVSKSRSCFNADTTPGSTNANDAVTVSLIQPGTTQPEKLHCFHPKFTYPVFGEEESIFGYQDLEIDIRFAAHNLQANARISYGKKFETVGDTVALDLHKTLKEFLPSSAFGPSSTFDKAIQEDGNASSFKPPGTRVTSYTKKGRNFEIWAGSLLDPEIRCIIDRIQIFILFFIEAGSYIRTDDVDWTLERWKVYFVYEVTKPATAAASPYVLAGYATTYRFYTFRTKSKSLGSSVASVFAGDKITPTKLPSRIRISQFLILPPYQSSGHGSALYQSIYSQLIADHTVTELTVEDPSEEFDKLRDVNDWKVLYPAFTSANVKIDISPSRGRLLPTAHLLPLDTLKTIRASTKIAPRQFARQLEMYLLSLIPDSHRASGGASLTKVKIQKDRTSDPDAKAYYWWRMIVKQRITKRNKELLQQVDLADRIPHIEESARAQEDEYEGLLLGMLAREMASGNLLNGNGLGGKTSVVPRKRKIIDDDDEEESAEDSAPPEGKRLKQ